MRSAGVFLALGFAAASPLPGAPDGFEQRVELLFRPVLAEQMTLSPDGRRVAYTAQADQQLHVIILDVENPPGKVTLNVDDARTVLFSKEKQRAQLRFLRWATPDRLVMAPTEERIMVPTMPALASLDADRLMTEGPPPKPPDTPQVIAPIMAVDADGQHPGTLVEAAPDTREPPQIYGFVPGHREQLIVWLPPTDIPGELVSLDTRTGKHIHLSDRRPSRSATDDGRFPLSFALQREILNDLSAKFPQRTPELMDWTGDFQHVLVRVTGGNDRGRVFIYQRAQNLLLEVFRSAPWLKSSDLHDTRRFEFAAADGLRLSGHVTWPRTSRLKPPPLLVCFPSRFPGSVQPDFDPEAQVFADLGFVVLRLNHRYIRNPTAEERTALRTRIELISVEDAATMIQQLAAQFPQRPFDAKHVATLGRGFGGYLAVRALQLRPDVFRAGIAIDAPMDLRRWLFPSAFFLEAPRATDIPSGIFDADSPELEKLSVAGHAESLTRPVMFLVEPNRNVTIDMGVSAVRAQLKKDGHAADYLEVEPGFALGLPQARAAAYRKIEEFINLRLYDYRVKIGPSTEVK